MVSLAAGSRITKPFAGFAGLSLTASVSKAAAEFFAKRKEAAKPARATKVTPLTQGRARDLAEQYHDRAVAEHNTSPTGDVNSAELDDWLRASLRAEVPPELLEAAFKQVMDLVFAM